jgi:hypothetical protein
MKKIEIKDVNNFEEIMALEWELDEYNQYLLRVRCNGHEGYFWMHGRPNYCDRGHWQVQCDYWRNPQGINTLDRADLFPRIYMSLESAKDEIARFIAWRALKISEGLDELVRHNAVGVMK